MSDFEPNMDDLEIENLRAARAREVRTTSATGGEKGVKPQRHDLLPKTALDVASEVYAFGAEKYADHNWRRKYEWSKSYAAAQRHLTTWWDCQDEDPESGLSHLGHAMFHLFAMATWEREDGSGIDNVYDDRWKHSLVRADRESAAEEEARLLAEQAKQDYEYWWPTQDLQPMQDLINQHVRNLVDWTALGYTTDNAGIFGVETLEDPMEKISEDLRKPITGVDSEVMNLLFGGEVQWRDPEVPTLETMREAMAAVSAILPARFVSGEHGIEDTHHPLTPEQNEAAEAGMVRIGSFDGGSEIWADRDALDLPLAESRAYLHHWINAHD